MKYKFKNVPIEKLGIVHTYFFDNNLPPRITMKMGFEVDKIYSKEEWDKRRAEFGYPPMTQLSWSYSQIYRKINEIKKSLT